MTDSEDSELADLLRSVREGDSRARERLFSLLGDEQRQGAVMLAMARKVLPRRHWARRLVESRDIVQSALRTGMDKLAGFRGETRSELYSWLRTILRTKVSRAARRRDAHAVGSRDSGEPERLDAPGFLSSIIDEDLREKLRAAIDGLPESQKVVVDLRLQGLDSSEIGRVLGLKDATVRKRESRAVEKLKEQF